jgi:glycosyltransferase involved in cell wall biosynthesis
MTMQKTFPGASRSLETRFEAWLRGDDTALDTVTMADRFARDSANLVNTLSTLASDAINKRLNTALTFDSPASLKTYELLARFCFMDGEWHRFHKLSLAYLTHLESILNNGRLPDKPFFEWANAALEIAVLAVHINFAKLNSRAEYGYEIINRLYAIVARRLFRQCRSVSPDPPIRSASGKRVRRAIYIDVIRSENNAIIKRANCFVEHDPDPAELLVLVGDIFSDKVESAFTTIRVTGPPSIQCAPDLTEKWRRAGATIRILEDTTFLGKIMAAHRMVAGAGLEAMIYHSGLASGVACVASYLRLAKVQIDCNGGLPMFSRAMDATRFWLRGQAERYAREFSAVNPAVLIPAIAYPCFVERTRQPDPKEVRVATAGNRLSFMLDRDFLNMMARLMNRCPQIRFYAYGSGNLTAARRHLTDAGVAEERLHFPGSSNQLSQDLAQCDLYVNTFTRGGGFVPAQAIMAGIPAVNIATVENGYPPDGARFLDTPYLPPHVEALEALIVRLVEDTEFRLTSAKDQAVRLWKHQMPDRIVPKYWALAERLGRGDVKPDIADLEWL